ncbi:uncharacterized protein LOC129584137 [Paramacrobiotus metropolitanus]|uniref:uncharacterized protein LOC129584137 n=1 Tax=Paramacrobiotus metropolitanus TaxID=2943436 RepID=UPI00244593F2|nr:uncharacterized protein LOC129584137 [Paramacrobiotus metropolitanus]
MNQRLLPEPDSLAEFEKRLVDPLADPKPRVPRSLQLATVNVQLAPLDYSRKSSLPRCVPTGGRTSSQLQRADSQTVSTNTTLLMADVSFDPYANATPSPTFDEHLSGQSAADPPAKWIPSDEMAEWICQRKPFTIAELFLLYRYFSSKE